MKSPKGNFRLIGVLGVGLIFMILVALSGGFDNYGVWRLESALNPSGWIFKQLNNIAEALIGLFVLYVGHRIINHKRTHEMLDNATNQETIMITIGWVIAIAYVIGNALR